LLAEDSQVTWTKPTEGQRATLASASLLSPAEFESRWRQIVADGRRDWVNLSAHGVWQDALVVLVEAPARGAKGSYPPDRISVNFSGPPIVSGWDLSRHLTII
jgi:hypothetical protein